jgi:hypothetical protein
MTHMKNDIPEEQAPSGMKSGMILAFALVVLLMMSLMGVIILSNTQTELKITGNTRLGREAFASADSCARIATFLTLVLIKPKDSANIANVITHPGSPAPKYPLNVKLTGRFDYVKLLNEATNFNYTDRYVQTGLDKQGSHFIDFDFEDPDAVPPHIIFTIGSGAAERVIATAVVNLETHNILTDGAPLGTSEPYESGDGQQIQLGIIVSVTGRSNTPLQMATDEPASVVTIMYRDFMS